MEITQKKVFFPSILDNFTTAQFFFTSTACDACDKLHVCSGILSGMLQMSAKIGIILTQIGHFDSQGSVVYLKVLPKHIKTKWPKHDTWFWSIDPDEIFKKRESYEVPVDQGGRHGCLRRDLVGSRGSNWRSEVSLRFNGNVWWILRWFGRQCRWSHGPIG